LRGEAPPITETLDPQFVQKIVATLFPRGEGTSHLPCPGINPDWDDELGVTRGELQRAIRRIK